MKYSAGHYEKPDEFLGGSDQGMSERRIPTFSNKNKEPSSPGANKDASGLDKPEFFLGGCGTNAPVKRMSLRTSWIKAPQED